jgi:hypothetical protein
MGSGLPNIVKLSLPNISPHFGVVKEERSPRPTATLRLGHQFDVRKSADNLFGSLGQTGTPGTVAGDVIGNFQWFRRRKFGQSHIDHEFGDFDGFLGFT